MSLKTKYFRLRDHSPSSDQAISTINVTPFIDIMLVLLVVFMISAPLLVNGVNINLPENSSAPALDSQKPFILTVTKENKIYYEDKIIAFINLKEFVQENLLSKNTRIYVRGDQNLSYGAIMKVIAEINSIGYRKVSLVTDNELNK